MVTPPETTQEIRGLAIEKKYRVGRLMIVKAPVPAGRWRKCCLTWKAGSVVAQATRHPHRC
jgi:hypothetical protein